MSGKAAGPTEYLVLNGINFPPNSTRREEGQIVKADELPDKKTIAWLERDGIIAPLDGMATKAAIELASEFAGGLKALPKIEGTGADDQVVKGDVEAYVQEHDLERVEQPEEVSVDG